MAKRKDKKFKNAAEIFGRKMEAATHLNLHPETKKGIVALAFLLFAAVMLLSAFDLAGPAGRLLYMVFDYLLGVGYYALPALLAGGAVVLFTKIEVKPRMVAVGGFILLVSGLGVTDIVATGRGGLLGAVGGLTEYPFGFTAALMINLFLLAIGALVTFNVPVRLPKRKPKTDPAPVIAGIPEPEEDDEEVEAEMNIVEPEIISAAAPKQKQKKEKVLSAPARAYVPPPLSLLEEASEKPSSGDIKANANIIRRTLSSFGIPVEMTEVHVGPAVTRFSLKPAEGIKLSRIVALQNDLSLALAAHPIRIEAPIPGKSLVGVEVPNKASALVRLRHILALEGFQKGGPLVLGLGKDVSGEAIFTNIAKMPHLLIAGSSGSGKSVAIHALLISLLYKNGPDSLRFILIDPKRVELSVYEGLPHMATPVIIDPKKAILALKFAISEMDRRYDMLLAKKARDIFAYNTIMAERGEERLPYFVVVIDELADLMSMYPREIEGSVVRLAQMARATGIHLVVSTQRPSVEVVTGLIKANITSRVALQVASQVDSRTILDSAGAEKLLGSGDLLFVTSELSKPKRIQGAYLTDAEIKRVTGFIREHNGEGDHVVDFASPAEAGEMAFADGEDADDPLYHEAVEVVKTAKKASASLLQRRLKVGYARAARLLDIMEDKGVVGPGDGAKPRDVYVSGDGAPEGLPVQEGEYVDDE